ncbi:hypothetical protein AWM75_00760 [Aerococcus urinaehominis]|uniref:GerMN domain-containing protein n=1 Tax=Aerococcus urinaehominis TaxID=128944 RepID=A0A0X8FJT2_9LACT|nr:GerMN domain-containing protein [Aerococcus urinaehominis]AMB98612.1 hypothetical protein AWM75_00760 [Aerococcus urinaehominis]SDL95243.1 Sporulation and spore germination [Aerococcus urinaehominis]
MKKILLVSLASLSLAACFNSAKDTKQPAQNQSSSQQTSSQKPAQSKQNSQAKQESQAKSEAAKRSTSQAEASSKAKEAQASHAAKQSKETEAALASSRAQADKETAASKSQAAKKASQASQSEAKKQAEAKSKSVAAAKSKSEDQAKKAAEASKASKQAAKPSQESKTKQKEVQASVRDYYPLTKNYEAYFTGDGGEFSSFSRVYDFISGNFVQMRSNNTGTSTMEIVRVTDQSVDLITQQPEFYVRENYIDRRKKDPVIKSYLKAPLKVGHKWQDGEEVREITQLDAPVSLPNGQEAQAIEVTCTTPNGVSRAYFAPGYGLVKELTVLGEDYPDATASLTSLETDGWEEKLTISQVDDANPDALVKPVEIKIPVQTNTVMRQEFEKILSGQTGLQELLPAGTKINALYSNGMDTSGVHADFSPEIENIRGETAVQSNYRAIFKTLADYYQASSAYFTVNNKPLEVDQVGPLDQPIDVSQW